MITQSLILFLMALPSDVHRDVTVECQGIVCVSRFSEGINQRVVAKHDWVHSVKITYPDVGQPKPTDENGNSVWGDTARLVFVIDQDRQPTELAKMLIDSFYIHRLDDWMLIERTSFSNLK